MIGRAQSLDIEFQRGVDHALRRMSKCLELGVMCCNESRASGFEQVVHDRARQRRALLRIGARAELIKDDQLTMINLPEDANDVRDMAAECAERLLDALLISDIGMDRLETWQFRAALRRDVQPTLRHQGQQSDGF